MRKQNGLIAMFLVVCMLLSNNTNVYAIENEIKDFAITENEIVKIEEDSIKTEEAEVLDLDNVVPEVELEDLDLSEQKIIKNAIDVAEENGKSAGNMLNKLDEENDVFDLGVKEVLDVYYSAETVDEEAVEEFSETLTKDIEERITDYTEAREERDNEENLDYVTGEGIVAFDKNTSKEEIDLLVKSISDSYEIILDNDFKMDESLSERKKERLRALESYHGNIIVKVNLDLDQTVASATEEFEQYDCVAYAEKDAKCEEEGLTSQLNDSYSGSQWYLDRCNFYDAWNSVATAGCDDIWIAVLDSGCRVTHKDLSGAIVSKYAVDITQKDSNGNYIKLSDLRKPYDSNHGTICTGIVAAKANNSVGIAGAASGWNNASCRAVPIKVSSGTDSQGNIKLYDSDICAGIRYAVNSGVEVISMSISGMSEDAVKDVIAYAERAGVIVVTSAGNKGTSSKRFPAALDYVIGVGGTDRNSSNSRAYFSCFGSWVNIVAPSVDFVSTSVSSNSSYESGQKGTSFATPLVASTVGLMLSMNPSLTVSEVKKYLYGSTTDINSADFKCGLLNAGLAVQQAKYAQFKNTTVSLTSVTALANNKIKVKWNDIAVYGPEKVLIYRATSKEGNYTRIKTLTGKDILDGIYTDSGLHKGTTYYYKIRIAMKYDDGYKYTPYSVIKSAKAVS